MAKKRYYQSKKDRRDEHRGMERYERGPVTRRLGDAFYDGLDERRRLEYEDGAMIREDRNALANLPQQVIMREFPREGGYLPEGLNDTIRGVDEQMDADNRKKMKYLQPEKY